MSKGPAADKAVKKRRSDRSILNRRGSKTATGGFNSIRDSSQLPFESRHELIHLGIIDADPRVDWFVSQPETFDLPGNRQYTPDALIVDRSGQLCYREVKPSWYFENNPTLDDKLADIVAACAARGAIFQLVTEAYYREPTRWWNARTIRHAYRRAERYEKDIVQQLLRDGARSVAEIERETALGYRGGHAAIALGLNGIVSYRMDKPIDGETLVRLIV